jgi:hypothetical protein
MFYDGEKIRHYGHSSIPIKKIEVFCDGEKLAPFKKPS